MHIIAGDWRKSNENAERWRLVDVMEEADLVDEADVRPLSPASPLGPREI
jgi:hypothetical protein